MANVDKSIDEELAEAYSEDRFASGYLTGIITMVLIVLVAWGVIAIIVHNVDTQKKEEERLQQIERNLIELRSDLNQEQLNRLWEKRK